MPHSPETGPRRAAPIRPGSMTQAMRVAAPGRSQALRVGVVRAGRIEDERLLREPAPVTVGPLEGNAIVVADPSLPPRLPLFARAEGGWALDLGASLDGRVVVGSSPPRALADLRRGPRLLPLPAGSRGKVRIGAYTILFQLVPAPPAPTRPRLPSSVRGGLLGQIDWRFTGIATATFLGFFAFLVALEDADWPVEMRAAAISPDIVRLVYVEPEPPAEPAASALDDAAPEPDLEPPPPRRADALPTGRQGRSGRAAPRRDPQPTLQDPDDILAAVQANLGALTERDGAMQDLLRHGMDTSGMRAALDGADAVDIASTGDATRLRTRCAGCDGPPGGADDLVRRRVTRTAETGEGEGPAERVVTVRPGAPQPLDPLPPDFDRAYIARVVRGRTRQIQACYEHRMGGSADLAGRVTVLFTVMPTGGVSGLGVTQNTTGNPGLAECVTNALSTLRFTRAPAEPVPVSYPFVFAPQQP